MAGRSMAKLSFMTEEDRVQVGGETGGESVFKPHGVYEGVVVDGIVNSSVTGPFNRELIVALSARVSTFFKLLPTDRKAAGLTEFRGSMLMTPEAVDAFRVLIAYELGQLPQGIVVAHAAAPDVDGRSFMPGVFAKSVYGPLGIPYRCFDTVEAARDWLRAQLAAPGSAAGVSPD